MKPFQLFILGTLIIFLAWGSLFITTLNQASQTRTLLNQSKTASAQNRKLLDQLNTNFKASSAQRSQQLTTLQQDMQCIATFFAQPDRTNLTLKDLQNCTLSSSGGATSVPKVQ